MQLNQYASLIPCRPSLVAGFVLWVMLARSSLASDPLPDGALVKRRMIERAQAVASAEHGPLYLYDKRAVLEQLDAQDHPTEKTEKLYRVELIAGFPFDRLVQIKGRSLTPEELQKEERKEAQFRKRLNAPDARQKHARKEAWVTAELLDRYEFTVRERVTLGGRATLVVVFQPKTSLPSPKTIPDRFLNVMQGTLWLDETEAETAKVTVNAREPVSLGFLGFLGSLNRCELQLERQRMPDGVWINARQVLLIHARKLASTMRFRNTEESTGFKQADGTNRE